MLQLPHFYHQLLIRLHFFQLAPEKKLSLGSFGEKRDCFKQYFPYYIIALVSVCHKAYQYANFA